MFTTTTTAWGIARRLTTAHTVPAVDAYAAVRTAAEKIGEINRRRIDLEKIGARDADRVTVAAGMALRDRKRLAEIQAAGGQRIVRVREDGSGQIGVDADGQWTPLTGWIAPDHVEQDAARYGATVN